jgi:hypothetical protein
MGAFGLVGSLSLIEVLIYSFIGANAFLLGAFLIQCGVKKLAAARAK